MRVDQRRIAEIELEVTEVALDVTQRDRACLVRSITAADDVR